ncbi:unnamed protein product, partial [Mesorhabditis spiculigera]
MSRFGDSSTEGSVVSRRIQEDFGDDVSVLSTTGESSWRITIFKVALGLFFIGACTAAIIYSVNKAEAKRAEHGVNHTKGFLPYDLTQKGEGYVHIFMQSPDYRVNNTPTYSYPVEWLQEANNKRIMYKVGHGEHLQYALYLTATAGYNQTHSGCSKIGMVYDDFFDAMGLKYVQLRTKEQIKVDEEMEDAYVYEGEPTSTAKFFGYGPSLVRGYSNIDQDRLWAFELFFYASTPYFKIEHWLPEMGANDESSSVLDAIPKECLN